MPLHSSTHGCRPSTQLCGYPSLTELANVHQFAQHSAELDPNSAVPLAKSESTEHSAKLGSISAYCKYRRIWVRFTHVLSPYSNCWCMPIRCLHAGLPIPLSAQRMRISYCDPHITKSVCSDLRQSMERPVIHTHRSLPLSNT